MSKKDELPLLPSGYRWVVAYADEHIYVSICGPFPGSGAVVQAAHHVPYELYHVSSADQRVLTMAENVFKKFSTDQNLKKWAESWQ